MLRNAGPITMTPDGANSASSLPSLDQSSAKDGDNEHLVSSSVSSSTEDNGAAPMAFPISEPLTIWASEPFTGGGITGDLELQSRVGTVELGYGEIAAPAGVRARPGGLNLNPILPSSLKRYDHRVRLCVLTCDMRILLDLTLLA